MVTIQNNLSMTVNINNRQAQMDERGRMIGANNNNNNNNNSRTYRNKNLNIRDDRSRRRNEQQLKNLNAMNGQSNCVNDDDKDKNSITFFHSSRTLMLDIYCSFCKCKIRLSQVPSHIVEHYCRAFNIPENSFCRHCCRKFSSSNELRSHKTMIKQESGHYSCIHCSKNSRNSIEYVKHRDQNHSSNSKPYPCSQCNISVECRNGLIAHMDEEHLLIPCPFCLQPTDLHLTALLHSNIDQEHMKKNLDITIKNLSIHILQHLIISDQYACNKCECSFLNQNDLNDHQINHECDAILKSNNCEDDDPVKNHQKHIILPNFFNNDNQSNRIIQYKYDNIIQPKTRNHSKWAPKDLDSAGLNSLFENTVENRTSTVKVSSLLALSQRTPQSLMNAEIYEQNQFYQFIYNNNYFHWRYLHHLATKYGLFFKKSILSMTNEQFGQNLNVILRRKENAFVSLEILDHFVCRFCNQTLHDLNEHYFTVMICCKDDCYYQSYCYRSLYLHLKSVYEKTQDYKFNGIIFSKYIDPQKIDDLDRKFFSKERIQQAREFDENYSIEKEVAEILSEFKGVDSPFYICFCMQCGLTFSNFKPAYLHSVQSRQKFNNEPGKIMNTQQSHVIYYRSLIRVYRHIHPKIDEKILERKIELLKNLMNENEKKFKNKNENRTKINQTKQLFLPGNEEVSLSSSSDHNGSQRNEFARLQHSRSNDNHQTSEDDDDDDAENDSNYRGKRRKRTRIQRNKKNDGSNDHRSKKWTKNRK